MLNSTVHYTFLSFPYVSPVAVLLHIWQNGDGIISPYHLQSLLKKLIAVATIMHDNVRVSSCLCGYSGCDGATLYDSIVHRLVDKCWPHNIWTPHIWRVYDSHLKENTNWKICCVILVIVFTLWYKWTQRPTGNYATHLLGGIIILQLERLWYLHRTSEIMCPTFWLVFSRIYVYMHIHLCDLTSFGIMYSISLLTRVK